MNESMHHILIGTRCYYLGLLVLLLLLILLLLLVRELTCCPTLFLPIVFGCDLDRCVSKYLDSQQLVGEVLRKANEAQLQQQQQMVQLQQQMGG